MSRWTSINAWAGHVVLGLPAVLGGARADRHLRAVLAWDTRRSRRTVGCARPRCCGCGTPGVAPPVAAVASSGRCWALPTVAIIILSPTRFWPARCSWCFAPRPPPSQSP